MKIVENDKNSNLGSSPNPLDENRNSPDGTASRIGLYQKCLECPDYGVTCNGPKLAALGDIMIVREFHRAIKEKRGITLKLIALAAPSISEYTVNDYFSHSVKDFKWTTVGCIDNALTSICGGRIGQPLQDHPCPASSTEISEEINRYTSELESLRSENARLQAKLTETKGKVISTREEVKEDYASRIQYLRKEIDRRDEIAADYLSRIDEKNKRIDVQNRTIHILTFLFICALIALTCYVVWDLIHPTVGLFQY